MERTKKTTLSHTLADWPKHSSPKSKIPNSFHIELHNVGDQPGLGLLKQRVKLLLHVANPYFEAWKQPESEDLPDWEEWYFHPKVGTMQRQMLTSTCRCFKFRIPQFHDVVALAHCNSQTAPFHPMLFSWSSCWMTNHSHLSTKRCRSYNRF